MRFLFLTTFSALLIPFVCASAAIAEPLTFDAALKLAEQSAPSLAASNAAVAAARSSAISAGRLPDPKIRAGIQNFPISGPPAGSFSAASMTMTSIGIMQEVPNSDKRAAARTQARAGIGVALAGQNVEKRDVLVNTALAWIDLYYAHRELESLDELTPAIDRIRTSAPAQLAAGSLRPAQTLDADQLAANLADMRADLIAKVAAARSDLVRWTGDTAPEIQGEPPAYAVDPGQLRAVLDTNPKLKAFSAMSQQADADVSMAKAGKRSDWGWDVAYQHRDPRWGDMVSTGVTFSLPLFQKTRQDPAIEAKLEMAEKVRFEQDAAYRQLQAALEADLADYAMHRDRLLRARMTLLPLAQKRIDLETASYSAGTASLNDVLQAQLALAETKIDALNRETDTVRDAARLTLTYGNNDQ
ncbi:TolC family protein [Asticcacaulis sp. EMRT-3]|uniref:TolC family protein n=1 Tax=Asticcacaulis sp. EMRT-3 TaxID=3040349 RepID=UPI0024AEDBB5|nr:TolC family protein [Asticcacaulis sp. EMRT-3]MDI7776539.1 TolC family protein [Asticcacaulis sp. EMRT-3]